MQVLEVTIGGERKRPAGQYASDTTSAFVKIQVFPGEDPAAAIARGHELVTAALAHQDAAAAAAPAALAEVRTLVLVSGTSGRTDARVQRLKDAGLTWSPGRQCWGAVVTIAEAERIEALARDLGLTPQRATPEASP